MNENDFEKIGSMISRHIGAFADSIQHKLDLVVEGHQMLSEKIDRVEERLDGRIDCLVRKLDAVAAQGSTTAAKLETVSVRLDAVAVQGNATAAKLETVSVKLDAVAAQGNTTAAKLETVSVKLDAVAVQGNATAAKLETVSVKLDAVAVQGNTTAVKLETVSDKLDAIAADLKAHRRDTEAHPSLYKVKEGGEKGG